MPTTEELIELYRDSSDSELFEIHLKRDDFTEEARKALDMVVDEKGGFDALNQRLELENQKEDERAKLSEQIFNLFDSGKSASDIQLLLSPTVLTKDEFSELIESEELEFQEISKDTKSKPRTFIGGIIGGVIGSILAGTMWGAQMIYSGRIFWILVIGVFVITYGPIRILTKQSYKNKVVLILTFLFSVLAFIGGQLLFENVGYLGPKEF